MKTRFSILLLSLSFSSMCLACDLECNPFDCTDAWAQCAAKKEFLLNIPGSAPIQSSCHLANCGLVKNSARFDFLWACQKQYHTCESPKSFPPGATPDICQPNPCACPDSQPNADFGDLSALGLDLAAIGVSQTCGSGDEIDPSSGSTSSTTCCTDCAHYTSSRNNGIGCIALRLDLSYLSNTDCKSGTPVGENSNSYPLSGSSSEGCFGGCGVSCVGADEVKMTCGEAAPPAYSSCTYTDVMCFGGDTFRETDQPAPEDCEGPMGINMTTGIEDTSTYRRCACDMWDIAWEFADRCGFAMAGGACAALLGSGNSACLGGVGGKKTKPPISSKPSVIPSPVTLLTAAGGAAWAAFADKCWEDPVNPAATNTVNCPGKRIAGECVLAPDDLLPSVGDPAQNNCPSGTYYPFDGADYCVEANQIGITSDIHDDYDSDYNNNDSTPNCPDNTYARDGLCWCKNNDVLYVASMGGCERESKDKDDYDPDYKDPHQPSGSGEDPYHVWVDNFHEVTDVLEAMKGQQCGWDKDNPCYVHVIDDTAEQVRKVSVEDLPDDIRESILKLKDIEDDTDNIQKNTQDLADNIETQNKNDEEKIEILEAIRDSLACMDNNGNQVCDVLETVSKDTLENLDFDFEVPEPEPNNASQCPPIQFTFRTINGEEHEYEIHMTFLCWSIQVMGYLILFGAYWRAARIYMNGVLYS